MIHKISGVVGWRDREILMSKHGDKIIDVGSVFEVIDSEQQYLGFRVGPVFYDKKQRARGLWINYQKQYMESEYEGPFLMSEETFRELSIYVRHGFRRAKYPKWICDILQRAEWAIADFMDRMQL